MNSLNCLTFDVWREVVAVIIITYVVSGNTAIHLSEVATTVTTVLFFVCINKPKSAFFTRNKMSSSAIIDFRPSHLLLNPHFDGYKLSLDPLPILKNELNASPRRLFTTDDQYTFLHAKLFSLHNHLIHDPWIEYSCYFIDENWTIQNVRYDTNTGKLGAVKAVHKVPKPPNVTGQGNYNCTLKFVSEKFCIFGDGCGGLKIFNTGDRYRIEEWKTVFSDTIHENAIPFVVQDARWEIINNIHQIQCVLLSIQQNKQSDDEKYETVLDWIVVKKDGQSNKWTKSHVRQLKGKTLPEYCVLEPKCNGILISADQKFEFSFDNEHPIVETKDAVEEDSPTNGVEGEKKPEFIWTQNDEDVTIHFNIPQDTGKQDITVISNGENLQVRLKNESLLNGELFQTVDKDLTTWNLVRSLVLFCISFLDKKIILFFMKLIVFREMNHCK